MIDNMSKNKKIFEHQWIDVYETEDHFIYAERRGKDSIAILAYKLTNNGYEFLIRWQLLPATSVKEHKLMPCCITGSLWDQKSLINAVKAELLEEGGITLNDINRIITTKSFISSTQMNETTHVYLIDVTNLPQQEIKGDGSYLESISKTTWISQLELKKILASDVTLVSLLIAYNLFEKIFN